MASTSDVKPYDPMEQVTPFFNRAQLYAFNQPPSQSALGRVNRGGSHDYLPQEYVRALLDRFIGQGRWAIRATLVKTIEEKIQKNGKENIAVTAIVNVELDILSALDPDKRLKYAGIGTHTMEAGADKGVAAAVGNAITSAESKGLKAAAKNLGRAFGSDLKNKLDRDTLPPSIQQYAQELAEKDARRRARLAGEGASATEPKPQAETVQPQHEPEARRDPEPRQQDEAPRERERSREPEQVREPEQARQVETRREPEPVAEEAPKRQPQRRQQPQADDASEPARADSAQAPAAEQAGQGAQGGQKPDADWELSIMPSNYQEWLSCIRTIGARVGAMKMETEIQNFIRRNKKTIGALPTIPAEGDRPERNFPMRFRKIVREWYEAAGLEVPAEYSASVDQPVAQAA